MIKKLKTNKTDVIYIGILMFIYLTIVIAITHFKFAYGSITDWNSQHYAFADYFRNLFYETKNFFPSFAPHLGAGQNIYNFSYYGLFNPLMLPSYLMPFVSMSTYVQAMSVINVFISVIMFYFWIKRHYDVKIAFFVSCLFLLAAPITFHSHRHIMFVWYFPFLIGALFCCDNFFDNKKRAGLIFCLAMIMFTSYYYSVGCYLAVFVYITAIFLNKNSVFRIKEYIKSVVDIGICMLISVMISAVLWLPTLYSIIQGRADTNVEITLKDILIPTMNYNAVLYSSYSMGLTVISLLAVVFALIRKNKGHRFIGIVLSAFVVFKLLSFIMNGFMYGEDKAIIPLIPVALLLTAELVKVVFDRNISIRFWAIMNIGIILGGVISILISNKDIYLFFLIDIIVVNAAYFLYIKRECKKVFVFIMTMTAFIFCMSNNFADNLCSRDNIVKVNKEYTADLKKMYSSMDDNNLYRVAQYTNKSDTVNKIYGEDYYTTTVYSSLQNQFYNHFYYDQFQNEMPHRNSAIVAETLNPFFYSFMGKKYLFIENETLESQNITVPRGYNEVKKEKSITMFKNDNVMPLGYASSKVMSCSQYSKLTYPYNMKALVDYTIVDKELPDVSVDAIEDNGADLANELFAELPDNIIYDKKDNTVYVNDTENENKYVVDLKYSIDDYLIITCKADNKVSETTTDIYLTINGVINKLTNPKWKYYNHNEKFCYVLSSNEPIKSIELQFSKGEYKLSDWNFYTVNKNELDGLKYNVDEFIIDKSKTKGDVFEGTVNVSNDNSYFKLSIPYDKGFNAYVDGKKTDIQMVDNAFIGFEIPRGKHSIKIVYTSPLLREAKIISLCGLVLFIFILSVHILRKRHLNNQTDKD